MNKTIVPNSNAGQRLPCDRCAKPLVVAADRKTDARMAIEADGAGVCAECVVTGMPKGLMGDRASTWFAAFTVDGLRLPHVQQQILAVLKASGSRLPADRLDWDEIIANWNLPLPKAAKGGLFG